MRIKSFCIAFALVFCGLFLFSAPKQASADEGVMPLNLYVRQLGISGDIDVVTGKLTANLSIVTSESCEIYTTMDVYKLTENGWEPYKSFRNPRSGVFVGQVKNYSDNCKVNKGYDYKVIATAYVTSVEDKVSETVSQSTAILPYK